MWARPTKQAEATPSLVTQLLTFAWADSLNRLLVRNESSTCRAVQNEVILSASGVAGIIPPTLWRLLDSNAESAPLLEFLQFADTVEHLTLGGLLHFATEDILVQHRVDLQQGKDGLTR